MAPTGNPSLFVRFFGDPANFPLYAVLGVACGLAAYTPIKHLVSAADIALDPKARNYGDNLASNPRYLEKARHYYEQNVTASVAHIKNGNNQVLADRGVPERPMVGDGKNFPERWQPRIPNTGSMMTIPVPGPQ